MVELAPWPRSGQTRVTDESGRGRRRAGEGRRRRRPARAGGRGRGPAPARGGGAPARLPAHGRGRCRARGHRPAAQGDPRPASAASAPATSRPRCSCPGSTRWCAMAVRPSLKRVINALGRGRAHQPRPGHAARRVASPRSPWRPAQLHRPRDRAWSPASAPRGRTTCTTSSARSPAPKTRSWSTTTRRPCCSRWRPPPAAARCWSRAGSWWRSATAFASRTSCARAAPSWSRSGTTNRTYLRDYERAWSERTRAVLRVHSSNYRIVGFADRAHRRRSWPVWRTTAARVSSTTSAAARWPTLPLFAGEPPVRQSVAAGADVVTFSGDKLLGGPQAGIAVGRAATIQAMRTHPLARALRIDKLSVAALDALLRLYLDPQRAVRRVPTLAMLAAHRGRAAGARRAPARRARRRRPGRRPARRLEVVAYRGARRRRRPADHRRAQQGARGATRPAAMPARSPSVCVAASPPCWRACTTSRVLLDVLRRARHRGGRARRRRGDGARVARAGDDAGGLAGPRRRAASAGDARPRRDQ